MRTQLTLCFIQDDAHVLLGMKKRGFGAGKWNGFGGKIEEGETAEEAARREVREEIGVLVRDLTRSGTLEFVYPREDKTLEVSVFRTTGYDGVPVETEEMRPSWFPVNALPLTDMWLDDRYWLPSFLEGKEVRATFIFKDDDTLMGYDIEFK